MSVLSHSAARAALIAVACAALGACATVTRGTSQAWTVDTDPGGAAVKTSAGLSCDETPCTFRMKRKENFTVTITKAGYKTWTGNVTHQTSGGGVATTVAGNAILGGLIGLGVDAASGATQDLKPNPLKVKLEPEAAQVSQR
jgi:PEGA domain